MKQSKRKRVADSNRRATPHTSTSPIGGGSIGCLAQNGDSGGHVTLSTQGSDAVKPEVKKRGGRAARSRRLARWKGAGRVTVVSLAAVVVASVAACVIYAANQWRAGDGATSGESDLQISPDADDAAVTQSTPLARPYSLRPALVRALRARNSPRYPYPHNLQGIDRRNNLSLREFHEIYDGKWPVLIEDMVPRWRASNWTHAALCDTYGEERVAMKAVNGRLSEAETVALPLRAFCSHAQVSSRNLWTYVEDELFIPMRPWLRKDIEHTIYWEDDLFKLFPAEVRPWDAMLLWGTAHSRSSLHIDPYNWTGTNAVIAGLKHWKLIPPGQDDLLYIRPGKTSEFPLNCYRYSSPIDAFDVDFSQYPLFKDVKFIEFDQRPGDLLIIPTGWFHQAYNLEETIAVSSQFTNGNNYRVVLEEILKFGSVKRSSLPVNVSQLSPAEQVREVMRLLPDEILVRGRQTTLKILEQMKV